MTRFIASIVGTLVALAALTGCGAPGPEHAEFPTDDQLVATFQAVGVPYDRFVAIQEGDRLIALKISAQSPRGDLVHYQWAIAESATTIRGGEFGQTGMGQSKEERVTGIITIPGLNLTWSRGSADLGWIYWPKDGREFRVYSRPFTELDEIDSRAKGGKWLERKQFRK